MGRKASGVIAVGARRCGSEIQSVHKRRAANARRAKRVVVEVKLQELPTGSVWALWEIDGRVDYGASVKCATKREAVETRAVMLREARLMQECTCGRRSPLLSEHGSSCGALTARRIIMSRQTKFALREWLVRQCHEYIHRRYDAWKVSCMSGGTLAEPKITGGTVACWLIDCGHEYAAVLKALGLEQAAQTCATVMDSMRSLTSKGKGASRTFAPAR